LKVGKKKSLYGRKKCFACEDTGGGDAHEHFGLFKQKFQRFD